MSRNNYRKFLIEDTTLIFFSIILALILVKTDILTNILTSTRQLEFLGSFITGMFFTSIFTTAPAIVTLGEIARVDSLFATAFFGAMGAVMGDLLIFKFIRDRFSEHLTELISHQGVWKRFKALFKLKVFRWLTFFAGGLIIASPLPDELGISLLGFAKVRTSYFVCLSFIFNFIGILLIGLLARAL